MALFHFLWLSNIPFILWYVDSWFKPYRCYRQTWYHEHPLMVRAKPRFPGRNLPDGLGLLEEFIWHGALPGHLNRTSHCPFHLPRWTAPNGALPSSFSTVISSLCSSQILNNARQVHFKGRIEGFGANSFTSNFFSIRISHGQDEVQHNSFLSCSFKKKTLVLKRQREVLIKLLMKTKRKKENPW